MHKYSKHFFPDFSHSGIASSDAEAPRPQQRNVAEEIRDPEPTNDPAPGASNGLNSASSK
jgi:hypothetical protein